MKPISYYLKYEEAYEADDCMIHFDVEGYPHDPKITAIAVETYLFGDVSDMTEWLKANRPLRLKSYEKFALEAWLEKKRDIDTKEFHYDGPSGGDAA